MGAGDRNQSNGGHWGLLLTGAGRAAGHKALGQVGCEEEAGEQRKEQVVAVPDHSFTPGTVTPAAAEELWGGG